MGPSFIYGLINFNEQFNFNIFIMSLISISNQRLLILQSLNLKVSW